MTRWNSGISHRPLALTVRSRHFWGMRPTRIRRIRHHDAARFCYHADHEPYRVHEPTCYSQRDAPPVLLRERSRRASPRPPPNVAWRLGLLSLLPSSGDPANSSRLTTACITRSSRPAQNQAAAVVRIWLGVFPVHRLNVWVNELTSLKPSSHAILDICSLWSSR